MNNKELKKQFRGVNIFVCGQKHYVGLKFNKNDQFLGLLCYEPDKIYISEIKVLQSKINDSKVSIIDRRTYQKRLVYMQNGLENLVLQYFLKKKKDFEQVLGQKVVFFTKKKGFLPKKRRFSAIYGRNKKKEGKNDANNKRTRLLFEDE